MKYSKTVFNYNNRALLALILLLSFFCLSSYVHNSQRGTIAIPTELVFIPITKSVKALRFDRATGIKLFGFNLNQFYANPSFKSIAYANLVNIKYKERKGLALKICLLFIPRVIIYPQDADCTPFSFLKA